MRKRRKKTGSVFRQLVTSYILFAVLLVIGAYICLFAMLIGISGGKIETLAPYDLVDEDGKTGDLSSLYRMGGWIEKLDQKYHVLEVYGDKKDQPQSYTQEEIYEYLVVDKLVDTDTSAKKYRGFMNIAKEDGKTFYYFVKLDRNILTLTYNYTVNNGIGGGKIGAGILLLFIVIFFGNCFLMSRYLARKIKKPLNEIIGGMEQVIEQGVDQVHLDFQAQKEFEEIRDSFNIMTERLEQEKREKRVLEEKKNRMLLELSHDIKTPVATIKSYANALEEGLVKDEDFNSYYQIIDKKAVRVDVLVNEMFLMLKLDNPEYELETKRTDLCELVRTVCVEYYEELEEKGIEMHIEIPETPVWADVDQKEFTRVIENLLGNIVKYNQTGHGAWVSIKEEQGRVEIRVADDGEPIAEEIRPVLFDAFVRGDRARTSRGGTGLGLAIAQKIVEKLGGEITCLYEDGKNQFQILLSAPVSRPV